MCIKVYMRSVKMLNKPNHYCTYNLHFNYALSMVNNVLSTHHVICIVFFLSLGIQVSFCYISRNIVFHPIISLIFMHIQIDFHKLLFKYFFIRIFLKFYFYNYAFNIDESCFIYVKILLVLQCSTKSKYFLTLSVNFNVLDYFIQHVTQICWFKLVTVILTNADES